MIRPPAGDRITVGMIGAGARAHELIKAIRKWPEAQIVAVVDAYKGRVERAIARTGARPYPDYRELLADQTIDAVVVATPDHLHRQIILDALRAGKDVYAEKPMTYTSSEGLEMIAAARETGGILQAGSQGMSSAVQRTARDMIRAGKLGKVTIIRATYNRNTASGAWIYPIPPDASSDTVNWEMFLGAAPKRPFSLERFFRWRCYRDYSGGIAGDLFVHLATTVHYLMGATVPARCMAMGQLYLRRESRDVPDTVNAILEYPEGFVVNLSSTFNNELSAEAGLQFLGTEGSISLSGGGLTFHPENALENNRWIVESWPRALEKAYYNDPKVIAAELEPARRRKKPPERIRAGRTDATVAHLGHFFDSVRSRRPYWQDATAGHHAAACAHMVNLSCERNRIVEWDFARDDIGAS